jgi:uncharacterized protein involved in exopolysaccharide biosynthesis
MQYKNEEELSLTGLALRHWRMILGVFFACIGLAGLLTLAMPRKYESQMKLLVNNERADLVISPDKNTPSASPSGVSEEQVNSEIELLRSHDILAGTVLDAKLYRTYQTAEQRKKEAAPGRLATAKAIAHLAKELNVSAVRKTNIIDVKYRADDPDVAAFVLRDLSGRYLTEHLAVHSAPGTYQFFTDEVTKHRSAWLDAQSALSSFHREKQLFALPQQQSAAVARLESVDAQIKDLDAQIGEEQTRLSASQQQVAATPERSITQERQVPNQMATGQLQTLLTQLQNRRTELAMKFKPGDRMIAEIDGEIANTQSALALANRPPTEQTTDVDPIHQSLKADVTRGEVSLQALQTRRTELAAMRNVYLRRLDVMDQNAVALSDLEQNEREAQESYDLYTRRMQEAKLANALDREKFSNVAVVEQPVASPIPVSPKLPLNLAVGAAMGLFLGLFLAFLLDSGRGSSETGPARSSELFPERTMHATASGD